ncbi:MAG: TonB-dependent receptor [Gammaproteobacteria bacterium]|nr:TonB-dependent receptor [Gammaproteobacteria bacterium]MDH5592081.1 TonB-dependent receptor [Gammaproteobacteria bacterium]
MKQSQRHFALRASTHLLLTTIAASTFIASVQAEETLETMTVTANRMPSVNVLAPTTVITRADIERLQINDLTTLLSRQPGIDFAVNGGLGKTSSIFMRGTNSDHVLILVDGVKWHSATSGSPSIQDFPVEQIERIEIVRGPRSGLYGAEALGGVIQIFTRKGKQGLTPYAKVGYGTHNSKQAAAGVSGGDQQTTYNLSFNHQSTEGINSRENDNPDKDGYRNNSISAKVHHQVNDKLEIGANFLRTEGFNEYDSGAANIMQGESVQQIIGTNASWQVSDLWRMSLLVSESRDKSSDFKNSNGNGEFNTRHRFANVTNRLTLSQNHTLNIGLDYNVDHVDSTTDYVENSRDNKAVFVSWQANVDKHSWLLSARRDDNEAFGKHNTGTAEWGYWLQDDLQVTANVGTAFKAPSFNELYWPGYGVTTLKPEEATNYGLGLIGDHRGVSWGINAYQNKIRNLIGGFPLKNINKAVIKGIEFDLATTIAGWNLAIDASFLKPKDDETGNILPRRSRRLANVHLDKQWGAWSTGASWKIKSHSFDNATNTRRLDGYGLLDIRVAYHLDSDWSLQANIANVFDKKYQTAQDYSGNNYNSLDRTAMVTLSYKP